MNTPRLLPLNAYQQLEDWIRTIPIGAKLRFGKKSELYTRSDLVLVSYDDGHRKSITTNIKVQWSHLYIHLERVNDAAVTGLKFDCHVTFEDWLFAKANKPRGNFITNFDLLNYFVRKGDDLEIINLINDYEELSPLKKRNVVKKEIEEMVQLLKSDYLINAMKVKYRI